MIAVKDTFGHTTSMRLLSAPKIFIPAYDTKNRRIMK